jgi:putative OPT family oligopeptide transporter
MNNSQERSLWKIEQLSVRSLLIGTLGSIIITASSMYVALKMSALPWPTIFVAVLSMALLKILGKTTLNEINIAQTGMSAGAMVSGGLAFTIPGLWISGMFKPFNPAQETFQSWFWPKFWPVFGIAIVGMILGTILCWRSRGRFIDREALPFPIGDAAAETLLAGDEGGSKARLLFIVLALSAVFTTLRDKFALIPQQISRVIWQVPVGISFSPMSIGIGYIIGIEYTSYWFAGALMTSFLLNRLGLLWGAFSDAAAVSAFNLTAAVGLMVGSGVGILISFIIGSRNNLKSSRNSKYAAIVQGKPATKKRPLLGLLALLATGVAFVISIMSGMQPLPSLLLMLGVLFATAMSATITGQTGINPMEIFGIIVLLAIRLLVNVSDVQAFLIAAAVAVACGYAGDMLNDYKAGAVIGTNPTAQLVSQIIGGLIGTVVATLAMFAVIYQYGGQFGGDTGLSAAQAHSVAALVSGIGDPFVFLIAMILGCLLYLKKVPAMIIGIGMLLPFAMSASIFLGGLIRFILDLARKGKMKKDHTIGHIMAAGFLGGEGITGVVLAIITMFQR